MKAISAMLFDMLEGRLFGKILQISARKPLGRRPPANTLGANRKSIMNKNFFLTITLSGFGGQVLSARMPKKHLWIAGIRVTSNKMGSDSSRSRSVSLDFCSLICCNSTMDENSFVILPVIFVGVITKVRKNEYILGIKNYLKSKNR